MSNLDQLHVEGLREVGTRHAVTFALFVFAGGIVLSLAVALIGAVLAVPATPGVSAALLFAFILLAMAFGISEFVKTGGRVGRVVDTGIDLLNAEIDAKYPAPPALPAAYPAPLPEKTDIVVTAGSREVVLPALVNGFDPRNLDWFAVYLANGNPWTEKKLEMMPLPHGGEKIGKEGENTVYHNLMALCTARGIIVGRGGPGNSTGKLAVTDVNEIKRLLKQP